MPASSGDILRAPRARALWLLARAGRLEMTDKNQSPPTPPPKQNESAQARQDQEPTVHACDDPRLGPRAFLLAVMHDRTLALTHRMDAAARLLRLFGEESFRPPRLTYRIEGFCSDHPCAEAERRSSAFERRGSSSDHTPEDNGKSQSNLLSRPTLSRPLSNQFFWLKLCHRNQSNCIIVNAFCPWSIRQSKWVFRPSK